MLRRDLWHIGISLDFAYDRGPCESLKASGLEKISNDSLRSALVRAYEVEMPLRKERSKQYNAENKVIREPLREKLVTFHMVTVNDTIFVGKKHDFELLKKNQNFLKYIDLDERVARIYRNWIALDLELFTTLIELINTELANQ